MKNSALARCYNSNNQLVSGIKESLVELKSACTAQSQRQSHVSDQLTKQNELLEKAVAVQQDELKNLKMKMAEEEDKYEQMVKQKTKLADDVQSMKDECHHLVDKLCKLSLEEESESSELAELNCKLAMYKTLTGIRFTSIGKDGLIEGYIVKADSTIKVFSFNTREKSNHYISNHLWELLE